MAKKSDSAQNYFRLYKVVLRLSGSRDNTIVKSKVTAPEIRVLQELHGGAEATEHIWEMGLSVARSHADERVRLRNKYQPRNIENKHPMDTLYPGSSVVFPLIAADAGMKATKEPKHDIVQEESEAPKEQELTDKELAGEYEPDEQQDDDAAEQPESNADMAAELLGTSMTEEETEAAAAADAALAAPVALPKKKKGKAA